jgi:hypothetical protein
MTPGRPLLLCRGGDNGVWLRGKGLPGLPAPIGQLATVGPSGRSR